MSTIRFNVIGKPQPAGSKTAFPFHKKNGKLGVAVSDSNKKSKNWKEAVKEAFLVVAGDRSLVGPLVLTITFRLARPKIHFGTGKNSARLKGGAPRCHSQKPDATKLVRCLEDALNGIAWMDDSQIVEQHVWKRWCNDREYPGAYVLLETVGP